MERLVIGIFPDIVARELAGVLNCLKEFGDRLGGLAAEGMTRGVWRGCCKASPVAPNSLPLPRVMRLPGWALELADRDHSPFAILALELIIAVGDGSSDAPSAPDLAEILSPRSCSPLLIATVSPLVSTVSKKLPCWKSVVDSADNGNKAERLHIGSLAGGKQIDEIPR